MPWVTAMVTAMFTAMVISMVGIQWWFNGWRGPCCQGHRPSPPAWAFFPCHDQCLGSLFCANSPRCFNAKSWSSMTWMSSGYLYFIAVGKPTGHREVAPREFDVHSRWKPTREAEEKRRRRRRRRNEDEDKGMHVFWTWAPFFWTCTCFLDLAGFFLDLGARKMWGMRLCVSWTLRGYFFGPACICAGPRDIFLDSQINCFWAVLLFFGPLHS